MSDKDTHFTFIALKIFQEVGIKLSVIIKMLLWLFCRKL